ncbi:MAG: hypothetical protein GX589_09085 [Deltaproteobacteria bacterium]|nr:hypothetical protein [Deltaproteobacteria bacterium]
MHSKLETRLTLIPYGYTRCYTVELEASAEKLQALADEILNNLLPASIFRGETLLNFSGTQARTNLLKDSPYSFQHRPEELFFMTGKVILPSEDEAPPDQSPPPPQRFQVSIRSQFKEFKGSKEIEHSTQITIDWGLPQTFPLREFVSLLKPDIEYLRFGFDLFRARFLSTLLGCYPVVSDSLLIEALPGRVAIQTISEGLKRQTDLPLQKDGWFEKTTEVLKRSLDFDLKHDYLLHVLPAKNRRL